jgi:peroxiredoxin family protein
MTASGRLSIIIHDGAFGRVHYALVLASAAAAIGRPVTLFFTMAATAALKADGDWGQGEDEALRARGIAGFEELLEACASLKARFLVCEAGLKAMDLNFEDLRDDLPLECAGAVTFLNEADGAMLFV